MLQRAGGGGGRTSADCCDGVDLERKRPGRADGAARRGGGDLRRAAGDGARGRRILQRAGLVGTRSARHRRIRGAGARREEDGRPEPARAPGDAPDGREAGHARGTGAVRATRNANGCPKRPTGGSRKCLDSGDSACGAWPRREGNGTWCAWRSTSSACCRFWRREGACSPAMQGRNHSQRSSGRILSALSNALRAIVRYGPGARARPHIKSGPCIRFFVSNCLLQRRLLGGGWKPLAHAMNLSLVVYVAINAALLISPRMPFSLPPVQHHAHSSRSFVRDLAGCGSILIFLPVVLSAATSWFWSVACLSLVLIVTIAGLKYMVVKRGRHRLNAAGAYA